MEINFTDLNLEVDTSVKTITFQEKEIEVKQYLPIEDKNALVSRIVSYSSDDKGYFNPMSVGMYLTLEIMYAYTNIAFTDEDMADEPKLYDLVTCSGLYKAVTEAMPIEEFEDVCNSVWEVIENIYKFNNSFAGALSAMSQDYENLNVNMDELQEKMGDPKNLELLRQVLTKLG